MMNCNELLDALDIDTDTMDLDTGLAVRGLAYATLRGEFDIGRIAEYKMPHYLVERLQSYHVLRYGSVRIAQARDYYVQRGVRIGTVDHSDMWSLMYRNSATYGTSGEIIDLALAASSYWRPYLYDKPRAHRQYTVEGIDKVEYIDREYSRRIAELKREKYCVLETIYAIENDCIIGDYTTDDCEGYKSQVAEIDDEIACLQERLQWAQLVLYQDYTAQDVQVNRYGLSIGFEDSEIPSLEEAYLDAPIDG